MPADYWQTFAAHLDKNIDIFWTGEKVCSPSYSSDHLQQVTQLLGRKPFLWDNYPVNDGAAKSQLLQLRAFDKSHSQLNGALAGHAVNPMNQSWLSRIPLASLAQAYQTTHDYCPEQSFHNICHQLCDKNLAELIIADINLLQDKGLNKLSPAELQNLTVSYSRFPSNPFAQEIVAWLAGDYRFDPACLTE
jgi:hyaluronoglucosaminidase